jgi:ribosomal protein S27E
MATKYPPGYSAGNWVVLSTPSAHEMEDAELASPRYSYRKCQCTECNHIQLVHMNGLVEGSESQCRACGYKTPRPNASSRRIPLSRAPTLSDPGSMVGHWVVVAVPSQDDMQAEGKKSLKANYRWCRCSNCGTEQLAVAYALRQGDAPRCRACGTTSAATKPPHPEALRLHEWAHALNKRELALNDREAQLNQRDADISRQRNLLLQKAAALRAIDRKLKQQAHSAQQPATPNQEGQ